MLYHVCFLDKNWIIVREQCHVYPGDNSSIIVFAKSFYLFFALDTGYFEDNKALQGVLACACYRAASWVGCW